MKFKKQSWIWFNQDLIEKEILSTARKRKQIVYGARSIQAQIGIFARPTQDYDIYDSQPKNTARSVEKRLDKIVGFDYFYTKKAKNPGTWKVKNKGYDLREGTEDDESVIDYTQLPTPRPPSVKKNGVRYRTLAQEVAAKKKALRDKQFAFRHAKDSEDLQRIGIGKPTRKF